MALTAESRAACIRDVLAVLPTSTIPEHLHGGLVRYFKDGILPGAFLQAVLCDRLSQAILRANDRATIVVLKELVTLLVWHAPSTSWGSRAAVLAWTTTPDRLEIPL